MVKLFQDIWVNCNELTTSEPWKSYLVRKNHLQMAARFRLVNYYNLPRRYGFVPANPWIRRCHNFSMFDDFVQSKADTACHVFPGDILQVPLGPKTAVVAKARMQKVLAEFLVLDQDRGNR